MNKRKACIIGGGIFGITTAIELKKRNWQVQLFEQGPIPHPLAASTDTSKVVRMDYGSDAFYTTHMERALEIWRDWNSNWPAPLFHENGGLFLCENQMQKGGFELESFQLLTSRGHQLTRLNPELIKKNFPFWSQSQFTDGYYNSAGGYAESGAVVSQLKKIALASGVEISADTKVESLLIRDSTVVGVKCTHGEPAHADKIVLACGSWTPHFLPELASFFKSTAHPIFYFNAEHSPHRSPHRKPHKNLKDHAFFTADISKTGYYGFPNLKNNLFKIAHHGAGREMHPQSSARATTESEHQKLSEFLSRHLPFLNLKQIESTHMCLYNDSVDGGFWIDEHPHQKNLIVATGDSGHAFKFAPLLGEWITNQVEGAEPIDRFRWRTDAVKKAEGARNQVVD